MPLTLLHTADWHIGKPFGRFTPEQAGVLRHARLEAIKRLADVARAGGANIVLVAGDVYDGQKLPDRVLAEAIARMKAQRDLDWHIIPGNHDHAGPGSAWARVLRDGLPDNVHVHLEARAIALGNDAVLLPAPLAARAVTVDPTAWMDQIATPPGALRIGLAHGSVAGFGSERAATVAIAPDRARTAGLDYLALGDWHGTRQAGPSAWYSGTPEPDGFLDNSPGHALLVHVEGAGAPPVVERRPTAAFDWIARALDASLATALPALEDEVGRLGPGAARTLLEVTATGRITLGESHELQRRLDRLAAALFHLDRRLDDVRLAPAEDDIRRIGEGAVAQLAEELARSAAAGQDRDARVAQRALTRLFELAAEEAP